MAAVCSQPELPSIEQSGDAERVTLAAVTVWLSGECSVLETPGIPWL